MLDCLLHIGGFFIWWNDEGDACKIEEVLLQEKPKVVLVYSDTNSILAITLVSIKVHIPVAYIEAELCFLFRRKDVGKRIVGF